MYLQPRKPMALLAAPTTIAAVGKWDLDFFASHYGSHRVPIDGLRSGKVDTLSTYIKELRSAESRALYMRNLQIFEHFPELRTDFEMPWIADPNWLQSPLLGDFSGGSWRYWVELFLSGPGSRFPFVHIDPYYTHAWSLQISGSKRFWLWPPFKNQFANVRDGKLSREAPQSITATTRLEGFFSDTKASSVILQPGELLFIPAGWWHTTETDVESATLGGNFVEASNWQDFKALYLARNAAHSLRQSLKRRLSATSAPPLLRLRTVLRARRRNTE